MVNQSGKHLTFFLDKEEYGIPIINVKEIIGMMERTKVPKMPEYVVGVINLRGKVIPIMDLRLRFGMEKKEYDQRTCIIVIEVNYGESKKMMGIVVDSVSEVVNIEETEKEAPPSCGVGSESEYLDGIGKVKGKVVMMLNIGKVLDLDEQHVLENIEEAMVS